MKVTVIATGFEPYPNMRDSVLASSTGAAPPTSTMATPAHPADPVTTAGSGTALPRIDLEEDDLDVPAFLRRRSQLDTI